MEQKRTRTFRIAQCGTFELENYGDLLFPLILERELQKRLGSVELTLFSPLAGSFTADPAISVQAITPTIFEKVQERFDAFIIGGGDLVSFRKQIAPIYDKHWHDPISAHTACWAFPSIYRSPSTRVLWNALGVPYAFSLEQASIVRELCTEVDYVSVRDDLSRERLLRAGIDKQVHIAPDTALLLPKHFPKETLFPRAQKILESLGLSAENLLVFQVAPHFLGDNANEVAQILQRLHQKYALKILLLPIGYCHEDQMALRCIHHKSRESFAFIEEKLHPLDIAALIACSCAFAGNSLHGAITAFAYEVPHAIINTGRLDKLSNFAQLIGRPEICVHQWQDFYDHCDNLLQHQATSPVSIDALCSKVEAHFDRISRIVLASSDAIEGFKKSDPQVGIVGEKLKKLRLQLLYDAVTQQESRVHAEAELRARAEEIRAFTQSRSWQVAQALRRLSQLFPLPKRLFFPILQQASKLLLSAASGAKPLADTEKNARKAEQELMTLGDQPRLSLLMVLDDKGEGWIRESIDSVRSQLYANWELCLVHDERLSVRSREILQIFQTQEKRVRLECLDGEATVSDKVNRVLKCVSGEFVGLLLQPGDLLDPRLLLEVVKLLNREPTSDVIYFDQDEIDQEGRQVNPWCKPDWSPDLLLSMNYIGTFTVMRKSLLDGVGGFFKEFAGNEAYELLLRVTEQARKISHIPHMFYHKRDVTKKKGTYLTETATRALQAALSRRGITGRIEVTAPDRYRTHYALDSHPTVSVIIPTRDKIELLRPCIESLESKTLYKNYEVIVVDNNSVEPVTQDYLKKLDQKHKVLTYSAPFNYARLNNFAAEHASGEYLLLLNNDTEVIAPEWMTALLEHAQRPEVGAVGAKLLFPGGIIQHAGVIVGINGLAGHAFRFQHSSASYCGLADVIRNCSAVTGACLMMRGELFKQLGGFDEKLAVGLQDIDLCLRLRELGYLNIYTPYACLYHVEMATRGSRPPLKDEHLFKKRWHSLIEQGDPYYNPNLTRDSEEFRPSHKIDISRND